MKRLKTPLPRAAAALLFAFLLLAAAGPAPTMASANHVQVRLHAVGSSGVSGIVDLRQRSTGGTTIAVVAFGLNPRHHYLSLYYDNHTCELEPYSADDVIGGIYRANSAGVGTTHGVADDDLDEINSVSVRTANFTLLACADVHPGG